MNDLVKSPGPADVTLPSELPARINDAHEKVKQALQRGAEHAIEAGRLLLQAKAQYVTAIGSNGSGRTVGSPNVRRNCTCDSQKRGLCWKQKRNALRI
jgi:hypothetical protein